MSATETSAPIPTVPERITIVLKAQEGSTLEQICQFVSLGMPVAIGRGMAVIAGASDEDLQMVLGEERDDRQMQAELQQQALGAPSHLAAHAQEMFDLLRRIDAKCGGLDAALGHGIEPSEQMWTESREAMEAIWELQDKIQSAASVDTVRANQTTQNQGSSITENPVVGQSPYSEVRVKNIDEWIRTLENAKRYEWLRDVAATTGSGHTPMVKVAGGPGRWRTGDDLDQSIDQAMRGWPGPQNEGAHQ